MVVLGPALSKELSLLGVVPVDFKTFGRTNSVLQSSLPPSGHHGEHGANTHCSEWEERWVAAAGRSGFSIGSRQEWLFHQELVPTWPPTAPAPPQPGWDCGVGEGGFTCPGFFCRKKWTQCYLSCLWLSPGAFLTNKRRINPLTWVTGWLSAGISNVCLHSPAPWDVAAGLGNLLLPPTPAGDISTHLKATWNKSFTKMRLSVVAIQVALW